jgi:hypothetical protein
MKHRREREHIESLGERSRCSCTVKTAVVCHLEA